MRSGIGGPEAPSPGARDSLDGGGAMKPICGTSRWVAATSAG